MWCDNFEYSKRKCHHFIEALRNNIVFFKERRIHLNERGLSVETNFGKGDIKVLVEGLVKGQRNEKTKQSMYRIRLVRNCVSVSID